MGNIYSSNRLESLCRTLAENIRKPKADVFGKEIIITETAGMNAWLKTQMAQHTGVFANFEFLSQDGLIAGIYQLLFDKKLENNIDALKYEIYKLLDIKEFKDSFTDVAGYYKENDLRRIQLSEKTANLFDQYQLYRNDMIVVWENGKLSTGNPSEKWQQWLWTKLNVESRSKTRDRIMAEMESNKNLLKKAFPAISFFGITIYTQFHLDFYRALEKYTDINFYLCLPANHKEFQNELLLNFGAKAKELAGMFDIKDFEAVENKADTLLARIQNQILNNSTSSEFTEDESLQVNSCYTPAREAECVYNYLLDLFDKDRSLKPGDVLVAATDINKYAPFIRAVFSNAPVKIPFLVSGAASSSEDTMAATLEQILNFREEDLTSEKVISLLEQKRIKQRFGIEDCDYIRAMVQKANIRFGRENRAEDDTQYVSWKYGLDKIILGYAMLTDNEYKASDSLALFPFREAEGSSSYDLLKLKAFVERLEFVLDEQSNPRTLTEWKNFLLEDVLEKMVCHDDFNKDDREEMSGIYKALGFINDLELKEKVPFAVFLEELDSKLFTLPRETKLNTGRVTVSSPTQVRGLPYRVICFLGLNNDIFPRKDQYPGFDLLGEEYRQGDRSRKETDKYLFMDTLLAAREKIYMSYTGQSVKNNSEIPPSLVVDTLTSFLGREDMAVKHPLHGFSSHYQKDSRRLFTYLYSQAASVYSTREKEDKEPAEATVRDLVDFFKAPVDWYFNNILDISYNDAESTLSETEIFELDSLQEWKVKRDFIKLADDESSSYVAKGIKEGYLPLKSGAVVTLEKIREDINQLKTTYQELIGSRQEDKIVVDIKVNNIRISGTIDSVYGKDFIAYSVSRYPLKHKIDAYIKALLLFTEGKIESAKFLDKDGVVSVIPADAGSAQTCLKALLEYFKEGNKAPLLFTIKAGEESLKEKADAKKILKAFKDEAYPYEQSNIPANAYLQILFREKRIEHIEDEDVQKISDIANKLKFNQF